jgi:predicted signal transduction protein with EAL and GGDEF domain
LTLVSVIINLAHALKLKVVAEGVETDAQLRELRLLRCDEMQGYLFGKAVPAKLFEEAYLTRPLAEQSAPIGFGLITDNHVDDRRGIRRALGDGASTP